MNGYKGTHSDNNWTIQKHFGPSNTREALSAKAKKIWETKRNNLKKRQEKLYQGLRDQIKVYLAEN